jgi:hypothetical protein
MSDDLHPVEPKPGKAGLEAHPHRRRRIVASIAAWTVRIVPAQITPIWKAILVIGIQCASAQIGGSARAFAFLDWSRFVRVVCRPGRNVSRRSSGFTFSDGPPVRRAPIAACSSVGFLARSVAPRQSGMICAAP